MRLAFFTILFAFTASSLALAQNEYSFSIARLKYAGGGDWYSDPQSLPELLKFVRSETLLDVAPEEDVVEPGSTKMFGYPYIYLTGHGNISLSSDEALNLRRYLLGGGFLHVDDNYGLDKHIRREMQKVFPEQEFRELPFTHEVFSSHFVFANGLPKIHEHDKKPPQAFGLFDSHGRLMVMYTYETDLGDGWEPEDVHNDPPDVRRKALEMGTNIIVYAMTN
ncbi:MAG: DUF4159 domain-containing protein [Rhodothermales bacterium]|nr:DUF4159 domain-containing protein [Rhodothermales bacterium]